jgi:hypothetical protein
MYMMLFARANSLHCEKKSGHDCQHMRAETGIRRYLYCLIESMELGPGKHQNKLKIRHFEQLVDTVHLENKHHRTGRRDDYRGRVP